MNKKLFVGNIPWSVGNEELGNFFSEVAIPTNVIIVLDRDTGRSRGFGFVEMATEEDAGRAIEVLSGKTMNGRSLIIREAKPESPRQDVPRQDNVDFGAVQSDPTPLFVQNIKNFVETAVVGEEFTFEFLDKRFTVIVENNENIV